MTSYQAIRDGSFDVVSPAVRELTGREPTALAAYLASECGVTRPAVVDGHARRPQAA